MSQLGIPPGLLELIRRQAGNDQPEETPTGGGAGMYGEEPAQQPRNDVAPQQPQRQPGLNDQGHGAVGLPLSNVRPQPPMRSGQAGLGSGWMPRREQPSIVQANPLTGILERIPLPQQGGGMGPQDPHAQWDVQQLEQAEGQINQRQDLSDQQKQFALNKIRQSMDRVDPQRQYRKDSVLRNMTPMEKFVAQNMHIDKEHGFAVALDSKGTPHFHKLEDNRLEMQKQFESHKMEMQQKHLDQQHAHEQHVMDLQQKMMEMRTDHHKAMLEHQAQLMELRSKAAESGQANRQAKMDEHSAFWKEYNSEVDKAYKRLTKTGDKEKKEADTPPTKEEVAAHLDEFFPHMRSRRWQIEDEAKKLNPPAVAPPAPSASPSANRLEASANKAFD